MNRRTRRIQGCPASTRLSGTVVMASSSDDGPRIAGTRLALGAADVSTDHRVPDMRERAPRPAARAGPAVPDGRVPRSSEAPLTKGPLTLVRCADCGLVQLLYSYERTELYGAHYGSSLNRKMVDHSRRRPGPSCGPSTSAPATRSWTPGATMGRCSRSSRVEPSDSTLVADFFSPRSGRTARRRCRGCPSARPPHEAILDGSRATTSGRA